MEYKQLMSFVTVARLGSFTKAAERLNYAQSTVSAHIQSLEEELGTKLFERLGRKVSLTRNGKNLISYAEQIIKLNDDARDIVSSVTPGGTITIGSPESLCVYRLPDLLQSYRRLYPNVEIILKNGSCSDFINWLKNNELDVAFFLDREFTSVELVLETLLDEPMEILAGANHPCRARESISPVDLHGETLILTEYGCSYRAVLDGILAEAGVLPGPILEFGSVEAIKKCTISGLGLTLLPRVAVEAELKANQLVSLTWMGPEFNIKTLLGYHKNKWVSPAMRALLELTRDRLKPAAKTPGAPQP